MTYKVLRFLDGLTSTAVGVLLMLLAVYAGYALWDNGQVYAAAAEAKIDNQLDVAMRIGADESKSASERVQANKDIMKYARAKKELDEYEKNVLYPLSTERIEIDLDDGVKVNYRKFGAALAKVKALEGKGE